MHPSTHSFISIKSDPQRLFSSKVRRRNDHPTKKGANKKEIWTFFSLAEQSKWTQTQLSLRHTMSDLCFHEMAHIAFHKMAHICSLPQNGSHSLPQNGSHRLPQNGSHRLPQNGSHNLPQTISPRASTNHLGKNDRQWGLHLEDLTGASDIYIYNGCDGVGTRTSCGTGCDGVCDISSVNQFVKRFVKPLWNRLRSQPVNRFKLHSHPRWRGGLCNIRARTPTRTRERLQMLYGWVIYLLETWRLPSGKWSERKGDFVFFGNISLYGGMCLSLLIHKIYTSTDRQTIFIYIL